MDKKKTKRKNKKTKYLFVFAIVAYISWTFISQQIKLNELEAEQVVLKNRVKELQQVEQSLIEEKNMINDQAYIEKIARERLKMVKPNEIIYIDQERAKYQD